MQLVNGAGDIISGPRDLTNRVRGANVARTSNLVAILAICAVGTGGGFAVAGEFTAKYGVPYVERPSGALQADTYIPQTPGPHPGVLVVHGGAWHMGHRAQLSGVAQKLAQQGFSAVAISYRLAPQDKFPAQIEDCKAAVRWMRTHAAELKLDPERIGGFGYSAGAHLVTLLGTTDSQDGLEGVDDPSAVPSTRLQAVAGGGTPCDFRGMPPDPENAEFLARRDAGGDGGAVSLGLAGVVCDGG